MKVQVCDFRSESFKNDFINSLLNTGFAVITNHGVPFELIKMAQEDWRMFFLSAQNYKDNYVNAEDGNMGYKGFGSEKALGATVADLKEFFHYKPGASIPKEAFAVTNMLYYQLEDLGTVLLSLIDANLEQGKSFRNACLESDNTLFRALYYPALDSIPTQRDGVQNAVRAAAHEDINFITLLVAASSPGLEVMDNNGRWHKVPHEENSVVVNVGDMLELATNGTFKSTTHRVVNGKDTKKDRVSMPLFIHPHSETILAPGVTAKQFLDERIAEIYGVGK